MPPPPPAEEPLRTRRRGGFGSGGMAELPWLRKQTKEAAAANLNQRTARGRPPSSATSQRPLSSSPSLLSLDNNQPSSPTTTAGPSYPSSGSLPHFRHSAAPTASQGHHSHLPQHPPRSHASLPVIPSSSSASHSSYPQQPGRHTNQQERIYSEARYDAEFDRGNASSSRAGPSGTQPGGSSGARGLFNPDSAHALAADARRREDGSSRRPRSKREPVVADDLGWAKRGKDSKDSLESEDSGRPGSRSSKEGRHRRRREGESGRRREEGEAAGGSNPQLVGGSGAAAASSRQLFDPRRDDPVKFSQGGGPLRKPTASDARSFAGSVLSLASSVTTVSDASGGQAESTQGPGSGRREGESNSFMMQLKRAYKDITDLETKLQDEHRAALAAAAREEEAGSGVRIQGGGKKYDDEYWVKLATGHKQCVGLCVRGGGQANKRLSQARRRALLVPPDGPRSSTARLSPLPPSKVQHPQPTLADWLPPTPRAHAPRRFDLPSSSFHQLHRLLLDERPRAPHRVHPVRLRPLLAALRGPLHRRLPLLVDRISRRPRAVPHGRCRPRFTRFRSPSSLERASGEQARFVRRGTGSARAAADRRCEYRGRRAGRLGGRGAGVVEGYGERLVRAGSGGDARDGQASASSRAAQQGRRAERVVSLLEEVRPRFLEPPPRKY